MKGIDTVLRIREREINQREIESNTSATTIPITQPFIERYDDEAAVILGNIKVEDNRGIFDDDLDPEVELNFD